jgi:hypothetical protein
LSPISTGYAEAKKFNFHFSVQREKVRENRKEEVEMTKERGEGFQA